MSADMAVYQTAWWILIRARCSRAGNQDRPEIIDSRNDADERRHAEWSVKDFSEKRKKQADRRTKGNQGGAKQCSMCTLHITSPSSQGLG